jgi:hypothetical protein
VFYFLQAALHISSETPETCRAACRKYNTVQECHLVGTILELIHDARNDEHKISVFLKIRPVGAELFSEDGQTYRHDEANSRFSQFCEISQQPIVVGMTRKN